MGEEEQQSSGIKRKKIDLESVFEEIGSKPVQWKKISREGLDLDYAVLLPKIAADELMTNLENIVEYYTGNLTKVKVFGKWHEIPRQQVAYGDAGLTYHFSGVTIPAKVWPDSLKAVRDLLKTLTGFNYNFVLVNRYKSGEDHIGEHRDGEAELDPLTPIASLSLGQHRNFVLKHGDCRKKGAQKRNVPIVNVELQHGSLLLMNPPTNKVWYHSLPKSKRAPGVRINLTFRKINSRNFK